MTAGQAERQIQFYYPLGAILKETALYKDALMKIGYPCINRTIGCQSGSTFRLKSYSEQRLIETVSGNLKCLQRILEFNVSNGILFFRITSDLIPFASHPINTYDWAGHFKQDFKRIGSYICQNNIRISMHPDQFTLINAIDNTILQNSIAELNYHAMVLDMLGLDQSAKIQIHIGGVYGNKSESIRRFIARHENLPNLIKRRLVIENDDVSYSLSDCLRIHNETGIPILFDVFHHSLNCSGQSLDDALKLSSNTWDDNDGCLMVDYSEHIPGDLTRKHAETIDMTAFQYFLATAKNYDFDIMLEIKDKENSALRAAAYVSALKS